jgi:hypothetical protein
MLMQLLGIFNNIAFLHDLTSRPGFATGNKHVARKCNHICRLGEGLFLMLFLKDAVGI